MQKFMKKLWEKKNSKKGFTLVELIVVLVILAILAAIMIPSMIGWIDKAKEKQVILDARNSYLAAQEIVFENYAAGSATAETAITDDVIDALSNVDNEDDTPIKAVDAKKVITEYVYKNGAYTATYKNNTWTITK